MPKHTDRHNSKAALDNFTGKIFSALRWFAAAKFFAQFISWLITLYVIRLLSPADYGLMAMAAVFISLLTLFNELGLGAAIIQAKEIEQRVVQQIFGAVLLTNLFLFLVLCASAPLLALFFQEPQVIPIVRVFSIQFILMALTVVPRSLLQRELKFKKRSLIEMSANLAGAFSTLALAIAGQGVWALVWGGLIIYGVQAFGFNRLAPFRHRPLFSLQGMRRIYSFGGSLMLQNLLRYIYRQADIFIIGRLLGKEALGVYSVGKDFTFLLAQKLLPIINPIIFPAFARIQEQREDVAYYAQKGFRLLSLFAFPAFWGISSVAPELVMAVLGEKWLQTVPILRWVGFVAPLALLNPILLWILRGIGRNDISLKNILIACAIIPGAIFFGCRWGIVGVSMAYAFSFPCYFALAVIKSAAPMGLTGRDFAKIFAMPVLASAIMYISVMAIKPLIKGVLPVLPELMLLVITGVIVYGGVQLLFNREGLKEVIALAQKIVT